LIHRGVECPPRFSTAGSLDLGDFEFERVDVHHDLAAFGREDADERANGREVELSVGTAADDEHLGAADPVDVLDSTELCSVEAEHGCPDDLMPVILAAPE